MLDAAVKALSQILSPPMRSILWRSIGLALVLIVVLAIGLQRLLSWFAVSGEGWAEAMLGPGFHTPLNVLAWEGYDDPVIVSSARIPSDQSIAQPLMVAFRVIVLHEFRYCATQRRLSDKIHPVQALFFDRANETLGIGVQIR